MWFQEKFCPNVLTSDYHLNFVLMKGKKKSVEGIKILASWLKENSFATDVLANNMYLKFWDGKVCKEPHFVALSTEYVAGQILKTTGKYWKITVVDKIF